MEVQAGYLSEKIAKEGGRNVIRAWGLGHEGILKWDRDKQDN